MKEKDVFLTILGLTVLALPVGILTLHILGLIIVSVLSGIAFLLAAIYYVVKNAVKTALKEHEKEKSEANEPQ